MKLSPESTFTRTFRHYFRRKALIEFKLKPLKVLYILFFASCILFSFVHQKENTERIVLHKHPNGKAKMVVYVKPGTQSIVYEELFYESGKLNYTGTYKNDVEHGAWTYYWPNGHLKLTETYSNGLEEGISKHYNEQGKVIKEVTYVKGNAVKEVKK